MFLIVIYNLFDILLFNYYFVYLFTVVKRNAYILFTHIPSQNRSHCKHMYRKIVKLSLGLKFNRQRDTIKPTSSRCQWIWFTYLKLNKHEGNHQKIISLVVISDATEKQRETQQFHGLGPADRFSDELTISITLLIVHATSPNHQPH